MTASTGPRQPGPFLDRIRGLHRRYPDGLLPAGDCLRVCPRALRPRNAENAAAVLDTYFAEARADPRADPRVATIAGAPHLLDALKDVHIQIRPDDPALTAVIRYAAVGGDREAIVRALCRGSGVRSARSWLLRHYLPESCFDLPRDRRQAAEVATAAHLQAAIADPDADDDLVDHTGRLLRAIANGRGLTGFPPTPYVFDAWLDHIAKGRPTPERYVNAAILAEQDTDQTRRSRVIALLDSPPWTTMIRAAHDPADPFWPRFTRLAAARLPATPGLPSRGTRTMNTPEPRQPRRSTRPRPPEPDKSFENAIRTGDLPAVRRLVEAGAVLDRVGWSGSPLRWAYQAGQPEVFRYLIEAGTPADAVCFNRSLLIEMVAHRYGTGVAYLAMLRTILEVVNTGASGEEPPLIVAIEHRAVPAVLRLILEHGATGAERRSDGTPAIVLAARRGDAAAVDVLAQAGVPLDATDAGGRTALMHAAERSHQQVAEILLTAGVGPAAVDSGGLTAMDLARGWRDQRMQSRLGSRVTTREAPPIPRTALRRVPTGIRLEGDPAMFRFFAEVVTAVLQDLGESEWTIRSGYSFQVAGEVGRQLRDAPTLADNASWHEITLTADEFRTVRWALVEAAHGTTLTPWEPAVTDLLEELGTP